MDRIKRFINKKLSAPSKEKQRRVHEFKRLVLNMPYTSTYYHYQKNPGSFFEQEDYEIQSGRESEC